MRDPMRPKISFQGRQFPRDGTEQENSEERIELGDLCLSVGSLSDALAYYREALGRISEEDAAARRDIIIKAVDCLRRQGKHEDALCLVEDLIDGFDGSEKRDLLAEKATLLCLLGRYGEAGDVCNAVMAEEHRGERKGDARIYLVLGHVLLRVCRWEEAAKCFERAATFARMCGDLVCLGNSLNNLGISCKNLCRFGASSRYLRKAVAAARREKNHASLAVRLLNLANTLLKCGDAREARAAVCESISIAESLSLNRLRVLAMVCRTRIEILAGDYGRAQSLIEAAVERVESLEDPRLAAVAYETLGELLTLRGDLPGARRALEKCADEMPGECRDVGAEVKSRMAELSLAEGDMQSALRLAEEGVRMAEEIGDIFESARCRRTLGLALSDRAKGIAQLSKAEGVFRQIGSLAEASITAYHMAATGGMRGREKMCQLERALSGMETCGLHSRMVVALCDLAVACVLEGEYERALKHVERAEKLVGAGEPEAALVSEARAKLDAGLSRALVSSPGAIPDSPAGAFEYLSSCVNASGLVLARPDRSDGLHVVEALGIPLDRAGTLARALANSALPAFISDASNLPGGSDASGIIALLALPVDGPGVRGLLVLTWNKGNVGNWGQYTSAVLRANHECRRIMPVFHSALVKSGEAGVPVCICGIISADPGMKQVLFTLPRISRGVANVLINGETGTGKELVARAIHSLSDRACRPFVAQNCAALPEQLLESELFGHKAGAFTGARHDKPGLLETADGGVFFLDEVGDVSPPIQAKMLRAIESGEIRRVGDTTLRHVDVRFVSATNKRLDQEVAEGRMRQDLYYRLNVVSISLPPLRDREGDIRVLSMLFLKRFSARLGKRVSRIEDKALNALMSYDWPGNVRQLENEIERAVTLTASEETIRMRSLSPCITGSGGGSRSTSLRAEVRRVERRRILAVLRQCGWNKTHAARALGDISRPALIAKMRKLGIPLASPGQ